MFLPILSVPPEHLDLVRLRLLLVELALSPHLLMLQLQRLSLSMQSLHFPLLLPIILKVKRLRQHLVKTVSPTPRHPKLALLLFQP